MKTNHKLVRTQDQRTKDRWLWSQIQRAVQNQQKPKGSRSATIRAQLQAQKNILGKFQSNLGPRYLTPGLILPKE